jgi:hypothetical protein
MQRLFIGNMFVEAATVHTSRLVVHDIDSYAIEQGPPRLGLHRIPVVQQAHHALLRRILRVFFGEHALAQERHQRAALVLQKPFEFAIARQASTGAWLQSRQRRGSFFVHRTDAADFSAQEWKSQWPDHNQKIARSGNYPGIHSAFLHLDAKGVR